MTKKKTKHPDFHDLEAMVPRIQRQSQLAEKILSENPSLGFVTAFVMAGDQEQAEYIDGLFQKGKIDFRTARIAIGSYARFDWVVRQLDAGRVKPQQVYKILPDLWAYSDPDDTNPRYLKLWQDAWEASGRKVITDGKALPRNQALTIYRGQDRTQETLGISWSLDEATARKFSRGAWARQHDRDGIILVGSIQRRHVLAYITGRDEAEIIADPKHVKVIKKREP